MNLENFSEFIKEPSHLYRINYQELKGMVLQYPNSINLRILLLLKSKMENHPDLEKNLREASVYAIDRSRIYELLKNPDLELKVPSNINLAPEGLEINLPVENVENQEAPIIEQKAAPEPENKYQWLDDAVENMESIAPVEVPKKVEEDSKKEENEKNKAPLLAMDGVFEKYLAHVSKLFSGIIPDEVIEGKLAVAEENPSAEGSEDMQRQPEQMKNLQKLLKHKGNSQEQVNPSKEEDEEELKIPFSPKPLPKERFESWIDQRKNFEIEFDALEQYVFDAVEEEESEDDDSVEENEKKSDAVSLAKRSLKLKSGIVSETLAELLVKQENYAQAIEMYEQLILKYPEKSAFFALQIENLKNS